jgi:hypothetical protein
MARNKALPYAGETSDWLELHNGNTESLSLAGWTLRLNKNAEEIATLDFLIPEGTTIDAGGHLVLICSTNEVTPLHTGFNLPKEGGQVVLMDPQFELVDEVTYEFQLRDRSYARIIDGGQHFHTAQVPDPGAPNKGFGTDLPIEIRQFHVAAESPDAPISFTAEIANPAEVGSVVVRARVEMVTGVNTYTIPLYDDGLHQDGSAFDGVFRGTFHDGLPRDGIMEYFVEIVSQRSESTIYPNAPFFARSDEPVTNFTLAWPLQQTGLQVSELLANNDEGIVDEQGQRSDWVEVRNVSSEPVSLYGFGLSQSLTPSEAQRYDFPEESILDPGGYLLIYLDRGRFDSPYHAPFKLRSSGESLFLTHTRPSGVMELVEAINVPALPADTAFARVGDTSEFRVTLPTPMRPNGAPGITISIDGEEFSIHAVPATLRPSVLESSTTLRAEGWETLHTPVPGIEFDFQAPRQSRSQVFFRLRELQ